MRTHLVLMAATLAFAACTDDPKRPLGGTCGGDAQCESGLCLYGQCLDPAGDEDLDNLTNGREGALGSNPFNPDSDYDGILDADEVGAGEPTDTDGDGKFDVVESLTADQDGDCLPDQLDPDDAVLASAEAVQAQAARLCGTTGVCRDFPGGIVVTCGSGGAVQCSYAGIAQHQADETLCDGLDNDCDGRTDEGQPDRDGNGVADCVDTDVDGDGVANGTDNCPDVKNDDQADQDQDGVGDACDPPEVPTLTGFMPTSPTSLTTVNALGTSEALAVVEVFADPKCTVSRGTGTASASGAWTASVTVEVGTNTFSLRARNAAGLMSSCVTASLTLEVDQTPPAAPRVLTVEANDWGEGGASFVVAGETEVGASVRLYSDAACATPVSGAEAAPGGLFVVTSEQVGTTVGRLYVRATDIAGNAGPCGLAGQAFGTVGVSVTSEDGPRPLAQVAVQFHYPDGKPAGPILYTDTSGLASTEGFAGFGATVDSTSSEGSYSWDSVLGLRPGQTVGFVRRSNSFVEVNSVFITLNFPAIPEGAAWGKVLAPCGYHYLPVRVGATTGNVTIPASCFSGATFDLGLVLYDSQGQPLSHLFKTGLPVPEVPQPTFDFAGPWSATGWFVNKFSVRSTTATPWQASFEILARNGDTLDSASYDYAVQALSTPQRPGSGQVRAAPIPGAKARWWLELPLLVLNGVSRVGLIGGTGDAMPLDVTLDAPADFLPRIYSVEARFPAPPPDGATPVIPDDLFWEAEPGLSRADAMTTDYYVYGPNAGLSWNVVARPSERGRLRFPKLPIEFPGANTITSAYYSQGGNITFFDAAEFDGFDDILGFCAPGKDCDFGSLELGFTTCCESPDRGD